MPDHKTTLSDLTKSATLVASLGKPGEPLHKLLDDIASGLKQAIALQAPYVKTKTDQGNLGNETQQAKVDFDGKTNTATQASDSYTKDAVDLLALANKIRDHPKLTDSKQKGIDKTVGGIWNFAQASKVKKPGATDVDGFKTQSDTAASLKSDLPKDSAYFFPGELDKLKDFLTTIGKKLDAAKDAAAKAEAARKVYAEKSSKLATLTADLLGQRKKLAERISAALTLIPAAIAAAGVLEQGPAAETTKKIAQAVLRTLKAAANDTAADPDKWA